MNRTIISTISLALYSLVCCNGCSANSTQENNLQTKEQNMKTIETSSQSAIDNDSKKLVVFFSHTGENYNVGNIKIGNTHIIADMIADAVGADRFEIVPEKPYPVNYEECIEIAKKEKQSGARPAIKDDVRIEDYDLIFLGYPNWWGEVPMCVYTFIDRHDWTGKTVIPFITHEGSGMGGTDRKIAAACKGANVTIGKGLAVQGKVAQQQRDLAERRVADWLKRLGL